MLLGTIFAGTHIGDRIRWIGGDMLRRSVLLLTVWLSSQIISAVSDPLFAGSASGKATEPLKGLLLKQQSGFVDKFTIQATAKAIRIDNDNHDYFLISAAPDWRVYIVRPKDKVMSVMSHQDWCHKYLLHNLSWTSSLRSPVSSSKVVQDGRSLTRYNYGATEIVPPLLEMRSSRQEVQREGVPNHAELLCLSYPGCEKTGPVIGRVRGLPPLPAFILQAQRIAIDGNVATAIKTNSINSEAKFSPEIFSVPSGCKIVPFKAQMVETAAANENTKSLIEDFMSH